MRSTTTLAASRSSLTKARGSPRRSATTRRPILQNHGLLTVGGTVDEAVWWFITMERSCQVQLIAEAALRPGESLKQVSPEAAEQSFKIVGSPFSGWFQFQPLYARILKEQPDFLD